MSIKTSQLAVSSVCALLCVVGLAGYGVDLARGESVRKVRQTDSENTNNSSFLLLPHPQTLYLALMSFPVCDI
jgi:hypothetical protein